MGKGRIRMNRAVPAFGSDVAVQSVHPAEAQANHPVLAVVVVAPLRHRQKRSILLGEVLREVDERSMCLICQRFLAGSFLVL